MWRLFWLRGPRFVLYKIISQIQQKKFLSVLRFLNPGEHWNHIWSSHQASTALRLNWWDSPYVLAYVNKKVGLGVGAVPGAAARAWLEKNSPGRIFDRAISIGCGSGFKEISLLDDGLVGFFDLFELSSQAVDIGRKEAASKGLGDRCEFNCRDVFLDPSALRFESYDIVYWNNSLHHMASANQALELSYRLLKKGGVLLIEDYVGPSRFQWSDENLLLANKVRDSLPKKYLSDPLAPGFDVENKILRPLPLDIIRVDPTEAVDSGNILAALRKYFTNVKELPLGGAIYHIVLNRIINNFSEQDPGDLALLDEILEADSLALTEPNIGTHYALALAVK